MAGDYIGALVGGGLGLVGGILNSINTQNQLAQFRHRQKVAINEARDFTASRVDDLIGKGSLYAQGKDYLSSTFGDAANSPLAQDYVKQLRAAQAQRGTLAGGAAVSTEAGGLAAFSQQLRAQLLPQLLQFAQEPERLRQSILGFEAPLRIAAKTGALLPGMTAPQISPSVAGSALAGLAQGAAGGYAIGSSIDAAAQEKKRLNLIQQQNQAALLQQQGYGQRSGTFADNFYGNYADLYESDAAARLRSFYSWP